MSRLATVLLLVALSGSSRAHAAGPDDKGKKPSLSLKLTPGLATAPALVRAAAEVKGGPEDFADLYCPTVEWDWGDDTRSESTRDCPPYEAGASRIARRYTGQHTYRESGNFRVVLRLKQKDRVVALAATPLQVQPGLDGR